MQYISIFFLEPVIAVKVLSNPMKKASTYEDLKVCFGPQSPYKNKLQIVELKALGALLSLENCSGEKLLLSMFVYAYTYIHSSEEVISVEENIPVLPALS